MRVSVPTRPVPVPVKNIGAVFAGTVTVFLFSVFLKYPGVTRSIP